MTATSREVSCINATKLKDNLGCPTRQLAKDQKLVGGDLTILRKRSESKTLDRVSTSPTNRGFLLGVSVESGHRRRIFAPHHSTQVDFEEGSIYIRDFSEAYLADLSNPFDFALLEISHDSLERLAGDVGSPLVNGFKPIFGKKDPVLAHLMQALLASFGAPPGREPNFR